MYSRGNIQRALCAIVASTFWGLVCVAPAAATITAIGDIDPAYDSTDPWELSTDLLVGVTGDASILVSGGSRVVYGTLPGEHQITIASGPGTTARLTVSGLDSTLESEHAIFVGGNGHGTMTIESGGQLIARDVLVGSEVGSVGHFVLTGPGTTWQGGPDDVVHVAEDTIVAQSEASDNFIFASIGRYGTGFLTVSDGARVIADEALTYIGYFSDGVGHLTVTDPGSVWEQTGQIRIGYLGTGSLEISNGGAMTSSGGAEIGTWRFGVSRGTAVVADPGSLWQISGGLRVGDGQLLVTAGGRVESDSVSVQAGGRMDITDGGIVETDDMEVLPESVLAGDGIVRATQITNRGILRPGNSIGTLAIDGNLTMDSGSVLETEIDNSGDSDRLLVTGDVSILGGTVKAIPTETITQPREYLILTAGSVTGRFQTLDVNSVDPSGLLRIAGLSYEPGSVLMTVAPTPFDDETVIQTASQCGLGTALQRIADLGGTPVTTLLQQVPSLDGVRTAYDQLAGQSRPGLAPVAVMDSARFLGVVASRLQGAHGIASDTLQSLSDSPLLAMASSGDGLGAMVASDAGWDGLLADRSMGRDRDQDWGVWGKLYGLYGDRDSESGVPGYSYDVFGQSFGFDVQFTQRFLGGITAGHSAGQVDYDGLADEADIDTTHVGLYGSYSADGWYLNSVAAHSWLDNETERFVALTGERHEGSFDGREWSGYVEAGLDWQIGSRWLVQPLAGMQVALLHLDGYAETGLSSALVYGDQNYESYKGSLGVRATRELALGSRGRSAIVQGRARWVHEFGDVASRVDARFEDVPTIWFVVSDEEVSRDSLLLGAGAGLRLARQLRAFVDYDVSLNADTTAQIISGAVEYRW